MALLSQFLMLLLAVGASLGQCPPREDILPCSCTVNDKCYNDFNVKVFCWKVDDVDDVRRVLQSVKRIRRVSVEFKDSRLRSVPSDLFKGLHITELYFNQCYLKNFGNVGRSALEGLEDIIENFKISSSFSEGNELRFLNVSGLRALESLNIGGNNMKELGNVWFAEGPENLKELSIAVNKITRLGDRAFTQLSKMERLYMGYNQFNELKRSMFPSPALHLNTLSLSDNKISSLSVDLFSDMPALKFLFLNFNSIQRIPEETWTAIWSQLEVLSCLGNRLECDSHIEWTFKQGQPRRLTLECHSPEERKGIQLKRIIDENQINA